MSLLKKFVAPNSFCLIQLYYKVIFIFKFKYSVEILYLQGRKEGEGKKEGRRREGGGKEKGRRREREGKEKGKRREREGKEKGR